MQTCCRVLAPCAVLALGLVCLACVWQPALHASSTSPTSTRSMLRHGGLDVSRSAAALAASPLLQAWEDYCQKGPGCGRHPPPPSKAYLISLPEDVLKREGSLALLAELGLDTEVITGIKSVQVGDLDTYSECLPAGSAVDCQAGLTLSHMAAWQALATSGELAAWVFEDDIALHDDILELFPRYWAAVPPAYDYIAVGQIPRHFNISHEAVAVAPEVMPWGTHAYIISAQTAERMALTAGLMVARSRLPADGFHTTAWQLDGEDIKIDHYLSLFYSELTPQADRQRWVAFDSTPAVPFRYGNVSWARNGGCQCSCADLAACAAQGRAPAWGMGLIAQHTCRERVQRLPLWWQEMARLQAAGEVEPCTELRMCGSLVCEHETLYSDAGEPAELQEPEEPGGDGDGGLDQSASELSR